MRMTCAWNVWKSFSQWNLWLLITFLSQKNIFLSSDSQPQEAPQGLYLHGGVGSGKTMLMDIFYDSIPVLNKKRVHFYSFMLQLYSLMNRWNLCCPNYEVTFDVTPVEAVASELAGEAWLLCFDEMQLADFGSTRLLEGVFRTMLEKGTVIVTTSNRYCKII